MTDLALLGGSPAFPDGEVQLAKANALQGLKAAGAQPAFRAAKALENAYASGGDPVRQAAVLEMRAGELFVNGERVSEPYLEADFRGEDSFSAVAVPQAMAYAMIIGIPPVYGLYTAIVGGFVVSVLGGSRFQIGGPAGAFIVLTMTGMDQEMMQKNISCRNVGESQKNMVTFSFIMVFVNLMQPGAGVHADPAQLDPKAVAAYTSSASHLTTTEFLMNIIPNTIVDAFAKGDILQVLFFSVLFGTALLKMGALGKPLVNLIDQMTHGLFGMVGIIMHVSAIGAFGAMAFTIGQYGIRTLLSLGALMLAMVVACVFFIAVVLGAIKLMLHLLRRLQNSTKL